MFWIKEYFITCTIFNNLAGIHNSDSISHISDNAKVMSNKDT